MDASSKDRVDPILEYIRTHDPHGDLAAKAVAIRLRRAAHYVETNVRRRLGPQGMEFWELELLTTLKRHGGEQTVGELQDAAQLTSGAITNRIDRLEANGHVVRTIDPADRRHVRVALTPAGEQRARELIEANNQVEAEVFADVDPAVLRRLADDLRSFLLVVEG